ncbi:MAG: pyridoxal phosphate-dependent aminotransferase [Acidobacteria bacterium]|nr:pyridoxal phosphate-dependent aminotransferase [Acidobacteriota bacterium]
MKSEIFARRACESAASSSLIRHLFEWGREAARARPELDIIDLSLGNPDLEPSPAVREALRGLVAEEAPGRHRYMDNAGFEDVRETVAMQLSLSSGMHVGADSVYLTCGAAGALQIVFGAILDPGDEVIVFAPYFPEYIGFVQSAGATPVVVRPGAGFQLDLEAFEAALTARTRAVVLNNPNNPTGVRYPASISARLASVLAAHRERTGTLVHIVADEAYAGLAYDRRRRASVLAAWDAVWLVRSCSKDASLAGERIGYFAWGPALSDPETMPLLRSTARALGFASAPALMQRLLPYALAHPLDTSEYRRRCERFVAILRAGGLDAALPEAGFFVFPRSPIADERRFCRLLADRGVLCVPGTAFGAPGYFRASLTQPLARIEAAAERITGCAQFVGEGRPRELAAGMPRVEALLGPA